MTTSPVMSITDELVVELEALAGKASPGPWRIEDDEDSCAGAMFIASGDKKYSGHEIARLYNDSDALYIEHANPATILALLADRENLKRDAERYLWLRDDHAYFPEEEGIRGGQELDAAIDAAMKS